MSFCNLPHKPPTSPSPSHAQTGHTSKTLSFTSLSYTSLALSPFQCQMRPSRQPHTRRPSCWPHTKRPCWPPSRPTLCTSTLRPRQPIPINTTTLCKPASPSSAAQHVVMSSVLPVIPGVPAGQTVARTGEPIIGTGNQKPGFWRSVLLQVRTSP